MIDTERRKGRKGRKRLNEKMREDADSENRDRIIAFECLRYCETSRSLSLSNAPTNPIELIKQFVISIRRTARRSTFFRTNADDEPRRCISDVSSDLDPLLSESRRMTTSSSCLFDVFLNLFEAAIVFSQRGRNLPRAYVQSASDFIASSLEDEEKKESEPREKLRMNGGETIRPILRSNYWMCIAFLQKKKKTNKTSASLISSRARIELNGARKKSAVLRELFFAVLN